MVLAYAIEQTFEKQCKQNSNFMKTYIRTTNTQTANKHVHLELLARQLWGLEIWSCQFIGNISFNTLVSATVPHGTKWSASLPCRGDMDFGMF